jgi:hypothetical protein
MQGNHDITLDPEFYSQYGNHFHNQNPQVPQDCIRLLKESSSIIYLENEAVDIRLGKASGPRTKFRIFGSPNSPRLRTWAFQYDPEAATPIWDRIPLDSDIVVTHTPPRYHCDQSGKTEGCEALRQALWRVRPRLAVCGHIHDARGAERIRWDLSNPNVRYKEVTVGYWDDPTVGTKKQSLLDLSTRGEEPLENDGSHPSREDVEMGGLSGVMFPTHGMAHVVPVVNNTQVASASLARGQGGPASSGRSDAEALQGRIGRCETCVVNACIMDSSYPYKGSGAERYNKPIVVDIDLPVWDP